MPAFLVSNLSLSLTEWKCLLQNKTHLFVNGVLAWLHLHVNVLKHIVKINPTHTPSGSHSWWSWSWSLSILSTGPTIQNNGCNHARLMKIIISDNPLSIFGTPKIILFWSLCLSISFFFFFFSLGYSKLAATSSCLKREPRDPRLISKSLKVEKINNDVPFTLRQRGRESNIKLKQAKKTTKVIDFW